MDDLKPGCRAVAGALAAFMLATPFSSFAQEAVRVPMISNVPPPPTVPESGPPYVTRPYWTKLPGPADIAKVYPEKAREAGVRGRATLRCLVTKGGALETCTVIGERPGDLSFGDAALKLSGLFKMKSRTLDGAPVAGAQIVIPVEFVPPGA